LPLARARLSPALTRLTIIERSNWAKTSHIWNMASPAGVEVERSGRGLSVSSGRPDVPPKGAHTQATRLLKDVYVRACIEKAQAKFAVRHDLTQDKIIRDVIDIGNAAFEDGNFATALKAKELIGRHIGMWSQATKHELTGPNGGPIPVMAATVVLPVEDMAPQQREVLRSLLLQAKAKERAMSRAQEGEVEE
jgi:phage terminase small subunit